MQNSVKTSVLTSAHAQNSVETSVRTLLHAQNSVETLVHVQNSAESLSCAERIMRTKLPLDTKDLLFRIKGGIELEGVINKTDEEGIKAGFTEAINELIAKVNSQAFGLSDFDSPLFIWPKTHTSTRSSRLQEDTQCKAILKYVLAEVSELLRKASKKKFLRVVPLKVINLEIHFEMTRPEHLQKIVVQHNKMPCIHFKLTLPIDVVVFVNPEEPWGKVQDQLVEAVTAQLSAMDKCIQRYTNGKTVPMPQAFHFELPEKTTLTTVIYPAGISDANLEQQRKELHAELGLDNKPFLRRTMAYLFPSDEVKSLYLRNIHKYIPAPDPDEFKVSLVHGFYTFHHCLQDYENDSDWGGLYRCLQVVISWFNLQGYIDKPVPTLMELQNMLSAISYKFFSHVIMKEWLEPEAMNALLNIFNISCTTMEVQANKPMDFSSHFEEQGTPVVISKFVIFSEPEAYILLGFAVNEDPKASKGLILNIMYTGIDDFSWIIEKAIEWKGEEFWKELDDYGLWMPQRPEGV
ncbi:ufm1-specific protease 2-like [Chiloscyllium plagiosum]|uniref:ufm1-specific protease 2-like n=1 Tax=Chiloscyllium plagiosum TaxID=36176 RepID=UPI001CB801A7|nr:ufm1-specific protease 2-like [Chiloscyllium plagiosum]